jgi:hypothetical protein
MLKTLMKDWFDLPDNAAVKAYDGMTGIARKLDNWHDEVDAVMTNLLNTKVLPLCAQRYGHTEAAATETMTLLTLSTIFGQVKSAIDPLAWDHFIHSSSYTGLGAEIDHVMNYREFQATKKGDVGIKSEDEFGDLMGNFIPDGVTVLDCRKGVKFKTCSVTETPTKKGMKKKKKVDASGEIDLLVITKNKKNGKIRIYLFEIKNDLGRVNVALSQLEKAQLFFDSYLKREKKKGVEHNLEHGDEVIGHVDGKSWTLCPVVAVKISGDLPTATKLKYLPESLKVSLFQCLSIMGGVPGESLYDFLKFFLIEKRHSIHLPKAKAALGLGEEAMGKKGNTEVVYFSNKMKGMGPYSFRVEAERLKERVNLSLDMNKHVKEEVLSFLKCLETILGEEDESNMCIKLAQIRDTLKEMHKEREIASLGAYSEWREARNDAC